MLSVNFNHLNVFNESYYNNSRFLYIFAKRNRVNCSTHMNYLYNKLLEEGNPLYRWCECYYDKEMVLDKYRLPIIYAYSIFKHPSINIINDFVYTIEGDDKQRCIYGINNDYIKENDDNIINYVVFPLFDTLYLNGDKYSNDIFPSQHFNIILSALDYNIKFIHIICNQLYIKYDLENKIFYCRNKIDEMTTDYQYIVSNIDKWLNLRITNNITNYQRIVILWDNICKK